MDVLIIGAGGHAWLVLDILLRSIDVGVNGRPVGLLDDNKSLHGDSILGIEVLGSIESVDDVPHDAVIVGIGDNAIRSKIFAYLKKKDECFVNAIHPEAIISPDVKIGEGTMICAGVVVNPGSIVGKNVILNTACTIDHHNCLGNHVHVAPGVHLGGEVKVGEGTLVGIGSTIIPRCRIGDWVTIGAGSVVVKDLPDNVVSYGVPARVVRQKGGKVP